MEQIDHLQFSDAYFIDAQMAMEAALENRQINLYGFSVPQLCYYHAEQEIENTPKNMIYLNFGEISKTLLASRTRFPRRIVYPLTMSAEYKLFMQKHIEKEMKLASAERENQLQVIKRKIRNQTPTPSLGERPLKVFIPTTSFSIVVQHAALGISKALKKLGVEVEYYVNDHGTESSITLWHLEEHYKFNPDIVVNINNCMNDYLNDQVLNIVWYQDPVSEVISGQKIHWRKNDAIYAIGQGLSDTVLATGAKEVEVQTIGIDEDIFYNDSLKIEQENKIVFVGGSYHHHIDPSENHHLFIKKLEEIWASNRTTAWHETEDLADSFNIPKPLRYNLFNFVIRDRSVEWLCKCSKIPVEIYGRGWENNPIVAPFFKGFLEPGQSVANLYRRSKYAIVPFHHIESQRFAEVGACGCIPVHYDTRVQNNIQRWNDVCLFYKNEQELQACLEQSIKIDSSKFDLFRYSYFAKRIINKYNAMKNQQE